MQSGELRNVDPVSCSPLLIDVQLRRGSIANRKSGVARIFVGGFFTAIFFAVYKKFVQVAALHVPVQSSLRH